ncbi:MAG: acyl-CoA dehydrogenase family protein, partial [Desulfotomaculales bacterium]
MDFQLPKRRSNLRDQIREFVEKEITREYAREIDAKDEYPEELLKK